MSPAPIYLGIALACAFMLALAACSGQPDGAGRECITTAGEVIRVRMLDGRWAYLTDRRLVPVFQIRECRNL